MQTVTHLKAGSIKPGVNPRQYFDQAEMDELIESVRAKGVIQPILVRPVGDDFQLVAGERRLRAAKAAHGEDYDIPVHVRDMDDGETEELALIENVQRAGMSPAEEAQAAAKILGRCNGDRDEAARRLGWKPDMLNKRLALMNCSEKVRQALIERKVLLGHAELLATATKERQDAVLERLLAAPTLVPVADFKATLEQNSKLLETAIFPKEECAGCQHNSSIQQSMFAEAIKGGHCTNGPCFDRKTVEVLEAKRKELEDEYPSVKIVQPGENFTVVKVVAEGDLGVGAEQAQACRACAKFGAAISNVPGKIGKVVRDQCFDPDCNSKKVAERLKAEKEATKAETAQPAGGAKEKSSATKPAAKAAATSVQDSQRVKDYRSTVWRTAFRKELFADAERSLTVLLAICMSGNARCISSSKLTQAFQKLTGNESTLDISVMAEQAAGANQDVRTTMLKALAPSVEKDLEERHIVGILKFLNVDLAAHWQLNEEFLNLLTKSEIDLVASEIGLKTHMGEKEFSKLMGGKKDAIIKGMLNVEGFAYQGKIPAVLNYAK